MMTTDLVKLYEGLDEYGELLIAVKWVDHALPNGAAVGLHVRPEGKDLHALPFCGFLAWPAQTEKEERPRPPREAGGQ